MTALLFTAVHPQTCPYLVDHYESSPVFPFCLFDAIIENIAHRIITTFHIRPII